jgi:glucokinase
VGRFSYNQQFLPPASDGGEPRERIMPYYIGLDLGGTNLKAGVVDEHAKVLASLSVPTRSDAGAAGVMDDMAIAARDVAQRAGLSLEQIAAVGVGSPGPLDLVKGIVRSAPNLPGFKDIPLRDELFRRIRRPTVLENDANAAGFGEFWAGAGKDATIRHLVMLTLGTGVGCGIVVDGHVIQGAYTMAGEVGHMILIPDGRPCNCGQRGCLEAYASATNTARRAAEAIALGESSSLKPLYDQNPEEITSKAVFDAAKAGDPLAQRIARETMNLLGITCVNICRVLDPQMIVFAGGMILTGDYLFDGIREAFARHNWNVDAPQASIVPAALGNEAGFIGAAAVAWDADQQGKLR